MIKLVIILVSLILSIITNFLLPNAPVYLHILRICGLFIIYIFIQAFLFFFVVFIVGIPISKKKEDFPYNRFYRFTLYAYTKVVLSLFGVKTKYEGLEKLPKDTNFVIVSNHRSNVDSFIMDVYLKKYPLVFVTKKSLFKIPFFGKIIKAIGYLKIDRDDARKELLLITKGINILKQGKVSIGVYPEGTRNFTDELLLLFKPGCFHLAKDAQKPIVIACTSGTEDVKHRLLWKRHPVTFRIIEVLPYDVIAKLNTQEISDLVKDKIATNLKEIEKKVSKDNLIK